jgi:putative endonuclease
MNNFAYMVECADGSVYCGYTNDLSKRIKAHNSGKGAKYTRSRLPVRLIYFEEFDTKEEAMSREWHLKQLSHTQKKKLSENFTVPESF